MAWISEESQKALDKVQGQQQRVTDMLVRQAYRNGWRDAMAKILDHARQQYRYNLIGERYEGQAPRWDG
jgi:hypothetical protein